MCRLLLVKSENEFSIEEYLKKFSEISKNSEEYQGDGWGFSYLKENKWKTYKNINPIWKDNFSQFSGIKTKKLIAHARSAFKNEGIKIENNMPFCKNGKIFIFNGELRGVKLKEDGRIGAEKIFNFINRFDKGNILEAIKKAMGIIRKKTSYIKAMNFIISDKENDYLFSMFSENPKYFTMHCKKNKFLVLCSSPFLNEKGWTKIKNDAAIIIK